VLSTETAGLLTYADRLHALSEGRFDSTPGVLRRAWRFDGPSRLPDIKTVRRLMKSVGWQRARWQAPELRPVEGAPRSVTVVAPTCTQAGMLATFAMLQGADADAFLRTQETHAYYVS